MAKVRPNHKHPDDPRNYLCLEMSDDGYLCNQPPLHDGDHIAEAGEERREVKRWPRRSNHRTSRDYLEGKL